MKKVAEFRNTVSEIDKINRAPKMIPPPLSKNASGSYETQLSRVCDLALETKGERPLVILLAGPSSSGKTTTAHKLSRLFCGKAFRRRYFVGRFLFGQEPVSLAAGRSAGYGIGSRIGHRLVNRCLSTLVSSGQAFFLSLTLKPAPADWRA